MKKRVLSILLCLLLCVGMLPQAAFAENAPESLPEIIPESAAEDAAVAEEPEPEPEEEPAFVPDAEEPTATEITAITVKGFDIIYGGATPAETFRFDTEDTEGFYAAQHVQLSSWMVYAVNGSEMTAISKDTVFVAGMQYKLYLNVMPLKGYAISQKCKYTFTKGFTAGTSSVLNGIGCVYTAAVTATEPEPLNLIVPYGLEYGIAAGSSVGDVLHVGDYAEEYAEEHVALTGWKILEGNVGDPSYETVWSSASGEEFFFEYGHTYFAELRLHALPGYSIPENCRVGYRDMNNQFRYVGRISDVSVDTDKNEVRIRTVPQEALYGIGYVKVFGSYPFVIGCTPAKNFDFDWHVSDYARQHVSLTNWYVVAEGALNNDDVFAANQRYRLVCEFKADPGYVILPDAVFDFNGWTEEDLSGSYYGEMGRDTYHVMTVSAYPRAPKTVTHVSIPGYNTIVAGQTPASTFRFDDLADRLEAQGVELIYWFAYGDAVMDEIESFKEDTWYSVDVALKPLPGNTLTSDCVFDFEGKAEVSESATIREENEEGTGLEWAGVWSVPVCSAAPVTVDHVTIPGIERFYAGTTAANTFQYLKYADEIAAQGFDITASHVHFDCVTDGTEMDPNDVFESGKQYSVHLFLRALPGYRITDGCTFDLGWMTVTDVEVMDSGNTHVDTAPASVLEPTVPVTHVSIPGYRKIEAGKTPEETFTFFENQADFALQGVALTEYDVLCPNDMEFLDKDRPFTEGKEYSVGVRIEPLPGYYLTPEMTFDFGGEIGVSEERTFVFADCTAAFPWTAPVYPDTNGVITRVSIPGYGTLRSGKTFGETFTFRDYAESLAAQHVILDDVSYYCDTDGNYSEDTDVLIWGKKYSVVLALSPAAGYSFDPDCTFDFQGAAEVDAGRTFPIGGGFNVKTDPREAIAADEEITRVLIYGYRPMIESDTPENTYSFDDYRDFYEAQGVELSWRVVDSANDRELDPDDPFDEQSVYWLFLNFEPLDGYWFSSDCEFRFVGGIESDWELDWLEYDYADITVYPEGPFRGIRSVNLQWTAPEAGETIAEFSGCGPATSTFWHLPETGAIEWTMESGRVPGEYFEADETYIARITVCNNSGYLFTDDVQVTVAGGPILSVTVTRDKLYVWIYPVMPLHEDLELESVDVIFRQPEPGDALDSEVFSVPDGAHWHFPEETPRTWAYDEERGSGSVFCTGLAYRGRLCVVADPGYRFTSQTEFTVNGSKAMVDYMPDYGETVAELYLYPFILQDEEMPLSYGVWVNGVEFTEECTYVEFGGNSSARYDPDTETLRLYGVTVEDTYEECGYGAGIFSWHDLTIVSDSNSIDNNEIRVSGNSAAAQSLYGIFVWGDLTVTGPRPLSVYCGSSMLGAALFAEGSITLDGTRDLFFGGISETDCPDYGVRSGGSMVAAKDILVCGGELNRTVKARGASSAFYPNPSCAGYTAYASESLTGEPEYCELMAPDSYRLRLVDLKKTRIETITIGGFNPLLVGKTAAECVDFDSFSDYYGEYGYELEKWGIYCDTDTRWVGPKETFAAGKEYSVNFTVTALPGYTISSKCTYDFMGDAEPDLRYCEVENEYTADIWTVPERPLQLIETVDVQLDIPTVGDSVSGYNGMRAPEGAHWSFIAEAPIMWSRADGEEIGDRFEADIPYTAWLRIATEAGYVITNDTVILVNGSTRFFYGKEMIGNSRDHSLWVYASPILPQNRTITSITIPGCAEILAGKTPGETFSFMENKKSFADQHLTLTAQGAYCDSPEWAGTLSWEKDQFVAGRLYSVFVVLEAYAGYEIANGCEITFLGGLEVDWEYTYISESGSSVEIWSVPVAPKQTEPLDAKFYATCSFDERLAVNYYVPDSYFEGYENVRLEVVFENWAGDVMTLKDPQYITGVSATYNNTACRKFTFSGISAPEVRNLIHATIYAEKDGTFYKSRTVEYSISRYCYNMLKDGSGADAGLKKLCVNVLNYASAAQTYFNMNPGNLANAQLTDAQKALAGGNVAVTARAAKTQISGTKKLEGISAKVNMASAPELIFDLTLKSGVSASSLRVFYSYYSLTGKKTISGYIPVTEARGGSVYRVKLNGFASADMRQPVTVKVLQGDTPVYDIVTYSLECYCTSMLGTAITDANRAEMTKLQPLCQQMMNYSNAAKEYFVK